MGITYIFITLSHTSFILDYKERVTDEMFVGRGFGASGASWEVFLPFFFGVCKYVCATWESRCWSKLNTEVFFFFFLIFFPPAYILRKKLKNSSLTPVYGSYLWVLNFKVTSRLHLNMNSCRKMNLAQVFTVNQFEVAVSCVFYARTHTHTLVVLKEDKHIVQIQQIDLRQKTVIQSVSCWLRCTLSLPGTKC